jgi:hypothetical protein
VIQKYSLNYIFVFLNCLYSSYDIDKIPILIFLSFITVPDVDEPLNITSVTTENTGNVNTTCFKRSQMTQKTRVMLTQHVLKVLK